jgi:hypothetical protein
MVRRVLFLAVVLGCAQWGCQSDAAAICEMLKACNLLPTDPDDPKKSLTEAHCESQVDNELGSGSRDKCADCVDSHACGEIRDACRSVCNPPY